MSLTLKPRCFQQAPVMSRRRPIQVRREEKRHQAFYIKKKTEKVVDVNEKIAEKFTLVTEPAEATEKKLSKILKSSFVISVAIQLTL